MGRNTKSVQVSISAWITLVRLGSPYMYESRLAGTIAYDNDEPTEHAADLSRNTRGLQRYGVQLHVRRD